MPPLRSRGIVDVAAAADGLLLLLLRLLLRLRLRLRLRLLFLFLFLFLSCSCSCPVPVPVHVPVPVLVGISAVQLAAKLQQKRSLAQALAKRGIPQLSATATYGKKRKPGADNRATKRSVFLSAHPRVVPRLFI